MVAKRREQEIRERLTCLVTRLRVVVNEADELYRFSAGRSIFEEEITLMISLMQNDYLAVAAETLEELQSFDSNKAERHRKQREDLKKRFRQFEEDYEKWSLPHERVIGRRKRRGRNK